jgi:lipoate-protein ligase B
VCGDLSPFDYIIPCGINDVTMTSIEKETGKMLPVADVARAVEQVALRRFKSLRVAPEMQLMDA